MAASQRPPTLEYHVHRPSSVGRLIRIVSAWVVGILLGMAVLLYGLRLAAVFAWKAYTGPREVTVVEAQESLTKELSQRLAVRLPESAAVVESTRCCSYLHQWWHVRMPSGEAAGFNFDLLSAVAEREHGHTIQEPDDLKALETLEAQGHAPLWWLPGTTAHLSYVQLKVEGTAAGWWFVFNRDSGDVYIVQVRD